MSTLDDFEKLKAMDEGERLLYVATKLALLPGMKERLDSLPCEAQELSMANLSAEIDTKASKLEVKVLSTRVVIAISIAGAAGLLVVGAIVEQVVAHMFS